MILQDLIRNYILYREVLRPLLKVWKDSLTSVYYEEFVDSLSSEFNLAFSKAQIVNDGEELGWDISDEYEAISLTKTSGTHTITILKTFLKTESSLLHEGESKTVRALPSRSTDVLLIYSSSINYIVETRKTLTASQVSNAERADLSLVKTYNLTTGYESKQINSFLFETHEKREYLGEFSLTHEEIHLIDPKKGGGYHDIDQESFAAII